jgi:hypothetical protein
MRDVRTLVGTLTVVGILTLTACATAGAASVEAPTKPPMQERSQQGPREGDEAIAPTAELFRGVAIAGIQDRSGEPVVLRSRLVEIRFDMLAPGSDPAAGPGRISLNLFDDASLVAVRERIDPAEGGGYVWVGRVEGAQNSEVTLAVGDGVMIGNIRADAAVYQVRFAGGGAHTVSQIDPSRFPAD